MSETKAKQDMREEMRRKDLLGNQAFKQTHLYASFHGIRKAFKNFFKVKELPFVHNNDVKQMLRGQFEPTYPYAYISFTSIGNAENHLLSPTIRRHSAGMSLSDKNSTITKHYMFPITLRYEFHYVTNDYTDVIRFISQALILTDAKSMNIRVTSDAVSSFVDIKADTKEITIPRADKDAENDPEGFDIQIAFTSNTWTGVSKEVAKVNNLGIFEMGAIIVTPDGAITDEEYTEIQTADHS
jgi:hypothetical protein